METATFDAKKGVKSNGDTNLVVTEIRNIQQMWDFAIQQFTAGMYDTEAMYNIYQAMNPKLTYQDIANVMSGVYADTYWNNTFMDPTILAKNLTQALGLDRAYANALANASVSQWRGVLARKNVSDIGLIPTQGDITQSIDIVCNQNTVINTDQLITQWNNQFWNTPQVGKNYIYVRCANTNFLDPITNPQVQMFYSQGGFNQPPTAWIQCNTVENQTPLGNVLLLGGKPGPLGPGVRGASEAFNMTLQAADHICVIAAALSDFFTKNLPLVIPLGNWNSYNYITHNGASAWHNFDPQFTTEDSLKFYNQDDTDEEFTFVARCKNVPEGTKIALSSDNENALFKSGLTVVKNSSQVIRKSVTLPGHHEGTLKVRFEGPDGGLLPASASLEINMYWKLKPGHPHYVNAVANLGAVEALRSSGEVELNLGSYTLTGGAKE